LGRSSQGRNPTKIGIAVTRGEGTRKESGTARWVPVVGERREGEGRVCAPGPAVGRGSRPAREPREVGAGPCEGEEEPCLGLILGWLLFFS